MSKKLADYLTRMGVVLQDEANHLSAAERTGFIQEALRSYSQLRPVLKVAKVEGDGGYTYDLPTDWEDGFSSVMHVEHPIEQQIPVYLSPERYFLYRDNTGLHLRFFTKTIAADDHFLLAYTIRHSADTDGSTPSDADFDAICNLAGGLACHALSRLYSQGIPSSMEVDVAHTWRQAIHYQAKGDKMLELYETHMAGGFPRVPAQAVRSLRVIPNWWPGRFGVRG
jgi:hypothetical protein